MKSKKGGSLTQTMIVAKRNKNNSKNNKSRKLFKSKARSLRLKNNRINYSKNTKKNKRQRMLNAALKRRSLNIPINFSESEKILKISNDIIKYVFDSDIKIEINRDIMGKITPDLKEDIISILKYLDETNFRLSDRYSFDLNNSKVNQFIIFDKLLDIKFNDNFTSQRNLINNGFTSKSLKGGGKRKKYKENRLKNIKLIGAGIGLVVGVFVDNVFFDGSTTAPIIGGIMGVVVENLLPLGRILCGPKEVETNDKNYNQNVSIPKRIASNNLQLNNNDIQYCSICYNPIPITSDIYCEKCGVILIPYRSNMCYIAKDTMDKNLCSLKFMKSNNSPLRICPLDNPYPNLYQLSSMFQNKDSFAQNRRNDNLIVMYHGTTVDCADKIGMGKDLLTGVKTNLNTLTGALGRGFYCTFNPDEAIGYAYLKYKTSPKLGKILLYEIVLNNSNTFLRGDFINHPLNLRDPDNNDNNRFHYAQNGIDCRKYEQFMFYNNSNTSRYFRKHIDTNLSKCYVLEINDTNKTYYELLSRGAPKGLLNIESNKDTCFKTPCSVERIDIRELNMDGNKK